MSEIKEVTSLFPKTYCEIIAKSIQKEGVVLGIRVPGFNELIGKEIQFGKRFGTELAYIAKMYGIGGIIHSDENMDKYQISENELSNIKKILSIKEDDAFILITSDRDRAMRALEAIIKRINQQYESVTNGEVRGAMQDGTTEFLRPLPGRARMYPETDLPLLKIGRDKINELKKALPKLKNEIKQELQKKGLSDELVNLIIDGNVDEFITLMKVYDKDANLIAKMVSLWRSEFASKLNKGIDEIKSILSERVLENVLEEFIKGKIKEGQIKSILFKIASGDNIENALLVEYLDDGKLEEELTKIVKEKPGMRANAYMGLVIAKLGAHVDKRKAIEILNRIAK